MDRPAFAKDFPQHPEIDRVLDLFERGNYARAREDARALVKSTDDDAVRAAAREILKRLDPEPAAIYLVAISALLLALLAGWYWTHPH
jgi:hypothetical protein